MRVSIHCCYVNIDLSRDQWLLELILQLGGIKPFQDKRAQQDGESTSQKLNKNDV